MLLTEKVKQIFKPKDNKKVSSVVDPYKIQTDLTNDPDSKLGAFYYDTEIPTDITRYFKYDDRSTPSYLPSGNRTNRTLRRH